MATTSEESEEIGSWVVFCGFVVFVVFVDDLAFGVWRSMFNVVRWRNGLVQGEVREGGISTALHRYFLVKTTVRSKLRLRANQFSGSH